jgi:hypothetical protein
MPDCGLLLPANRLERHEAHFCTSRTRAKLAQRWQRARDRGPYQRPWGEPPVTAAVVVSSSTVTAATASSASKAAAQANGAAAAVQLHMQ